MRPLRRRWRAALATAAVAATSAALTVATPSTAAAAPAGGGLTGTFRTITKGAALPFPTGQTVGTPAGVQSPEIPREPEEAVDRDRGLTERRSAATVSPAGVPVVRPAPVSGRNGLVRSFHGLDGFDQRFANNGNQFSRRAAGPGAVRRATATSSRRPTTSCGSQRQGRVGGQTGVLDLNTFFGYPAGDRPHHRRLQGPLSPIRSASSTPTHEPVLPRRAHPGVDPDTGDVHRHATPRPRGQPDPEPDRQLEHLPAPGHRRRHATAPRCTADCPCIGDYPHIGADTQRHLHDHQRVPVLRRRRVRQQLQRRADLRLLTSARWPRGAADGLRRRSSRTRSAAARPRRCTGFTVWPATSPAPRTRPAQQRHRVLPVLHRRRGGQPATSPAGLDSIGVWQLTNTGRSTPARPRLRLSTAGARRPSGTCCRRCRTQKTGPIPLAECVNDDPCATFRLGAPDPFEPARRGRPLDSNDTRMQQV